MTPKQEAIEAVARTINTNLGEQWNAKPVVECIEGAWSAEGGVIDLSELGEAAFSETIRQLVEMEWPDSKLIAGGTRGAFYSTPARVEWAKAMLKQLLEE